MELVKPTGWVCLSLSGTDPRYVLCAVFVSYQNFWEAILA